MGQSCSGSAIDDAPLIRGLPLEPGPSRCENPAVPSRKTASSYDGSLLPEPCLPVCTSAFAISQQRSHGRSNEYIDRGKIGQGVSANVFLAEAGAGTAGLPSCMSRSHCASWESSTLCSSGWFGTAAKRRVAIKRFLRPGAESFALELDAHSRVGVHPHVLRLLESLRTERSEDMLVYEYCDGMTVWSAFQAEQKRGALLHKVLVARMMRQLLLALEHIAACGIEHQDVKPENMLLYDYSPEERTAQLKLGDFGWATQGPWCAKRKLPGDGIGSLWYAAPEMNPPVKGVEASQSTRASETDDVACEEAVSHCEPYAKAANLTTRVGLSDMWSAAVVIYLLHVGHNPFAAAARKPGKSVEAEVIQLVAEGRFDHECPQWTQLPSNLKEFIRASLQVTPALRPSATQALRCTQIFTSVARRNECEPLALEGHAADREEAWSTLGGFQQLAWLAVARVVGEPELRREVVAAASREARAFASSRPLSTNTEDTYLYQLAKVISHASSEQAWLRDPSALPEFLRLAFNYLDVDGDGFLSSCDLLAHVSADVEVSRPAVSCWISRWWDSSESPVAEHAQDGLSRTSFRNALGLRCRMPQEMPRFAEGPCCGRGESTMWHDPFFSKQSYAVA